MRKDIYPPYDIKDSLDFTIHDFKHSLKFSDPIIFYEQVGFLSSLSSILPLRLSGDLQFRRDVAHVMCDMNSNVIPLIDFLVQKWIKGFLRNGTDGRGAIDMLDLLIGENCGRRIGEEWKGLNVDSVRDFFHFMGVECLGRKRVDWPLLELEKEVFFRGYES